jgi:hypothetical protein
MMPYSEREVRRIAHVGFRAAQGRDKNLCSPMRTKPRVADHGLKVRFDCHNGALLID